MFDSVFVKCPNCKHEREYQSKAGPCAGYAYTMLTAPQAVLADVADSHGLELCEACGKVKFRVACMASFHINEEPVLEIGTNRLRQSLIAHGADVAKDVPLIITAPMPGDKTRTAKFVIERCGGCDGGYEIVLGQLADG